MAASKQLKTVKVVIDWKSCEKFQPDGFKIGSKDGILNSLKKQVIGSLFIVFQTKENKAYRIFDGHSRYDVMSENPNLFAEKYEMELIQFDDDKQAAEALIHFQAGKLKIDRTEFEEFIEVHELESSDYFIEEYDLVVIEDTDESEKDEKEPKINEPNSDIYLNVKMENEREAEKLFNELQNKGYECKIIS